MPIVVLPLRSSDYLWMRLVHTVVKMAPRDSYLEQNASRDLQATLFGFFCFCCGMRLVQTVVKIKLGKYSRINRLWFLPFPDCFWFSYLSVLVLSPFLCLQMNLLWMTLVHTVVKTPKKNPEKSLWNQEIFLRPYVVCFQLSLRCQSWSSLPVLGNNPEQRIQVHKPSLDLRKLFFLSAVFIPSFFLPFWESGWSIPPHLCVCQWVSMDEIRAHCGAVCVWLRLSASLAMQKAFLSDENQETSTGCTRKLFSCKAWGTAELSTFMIFFVKGGIE